MANSAKNVTVNVSNANAVESQSLKGHLKPLGKDELNELAKVQKQRENLVNAYGIVNAICDDCGITIPNGFKEGFLEIWNLYCTNNPFKF